MAKRKHWPYAVYHPADSNKIMHAPLLYRVRACMFTDDGTDVVYVTFGMHNLRKVVIIKEWHSLLFFL